MKTSTIRVSNGVEAVSIQIEGVTPGFEQVITPDADEAVEVAIDILLHAQALRDGIHGSSLDKPTTQKARRDAAHKILNWEPPVQVEGVLITRLRRAVAVGTSGDIKAIAARIVQASTKEDQK